METSNRYLPLLGRVMIGAPFLFDGKRPAAAAHSASGMPASKPTAIAAIAFQILCRPSSAMVTVACSSPAVT